MRAEIAPLIVDGKSVTQMYLHALGDGLDFRSELHVAHYPDGDTTQEPQYYNTVTQPTDELLKLQYDVLDIPVHDRYVVEQLLGSFRWVRYHHSSDKHTRGGQIFTDYPAMAEGRWTISYW